MDILVLRELCDEYLRIEAAMHWQDTLTKRAELNLQLDVTRRAIYDQVRQGGDFWNKKHHAQHRPRPGDDIKTGE